jgi:hypothetical protein
MKMAIRALMHISLYVFSACSFITLAVADERHECVGHYELALPDKADIATTTSRIFGKSGDEHRIQFLDGQPADLSSFNGFEIVRDMTLSQYESLQADVKARLAKVAKNDDYSVQTEIPTGQVHSIAYLGAISGGMYIYKDGQIVAFNTFSYQDSAAVKHSLYEVLNGLEFRRDYEIPKGEGICMPGIFVAANGNSSRNIAVTFRLAEHPDVTIMFKEKTSSQPVNFVDVHNMPVGRQANLTSREQNEFVWKYSGLGQEVKLDHDPLPFHTVELDGRKGVSSFGTIKRDDGTTDYGYLATVQGDPNAAVDTPDLTLLIQRTAKYAKGNPLVSNEELKQIAKDIAASVKRRPVE